MTASPQQPLLSEEEYLTLERASSVKHEYHAGAIFAMSGVSEAHNLIASNVNASLHAQLRGRGCRVYPSDMRLKVLATGLHPYPDLTIVCGPPEFTNPARRDTLVNPVVIIDILSPSTERYDRGEKFQHYRTIPTLREYLLIAQDRARIEQYVRQADGLWLLAEAVGAAATLALPALQCALRLADVYEQVELPAQPPFIPHELPE
jgi:Uma2 family endonuclease